MDKRIEVAGVILVLLLTLYFWTSPISDLPFGDVDSSAHFAVADYMSQKNVPLYWLPPYLNQQYGFSSGGRLWYPPHFHLDAAIAQLFNPDRFVSVYLFAALAASAVVLTSYILIRSLYGFWVAILSSFFLSFSLRDYTYYLLGLWPQSASFAMIPLVLYCYWKSTSLYLTNAGARVDTNTDTNIDIKADKKRAAQYLIVMFILLSTQFAFHPYGFFHSVAAIGLFSVLLFFQHRKLPFDFKHVLIGAIIFLILILPFYGFVAKQAGTEVGSGAAVALDFPLSRLFSWYLDYQKWGVGAYPESFFSYAAAHGWWTLPLLLVGIAALLLRRKPEDWFMLAWLASYYILIHMDLFGYGGRVPRSYGAEAQIFYPIIVLGVFGVFSMASFLKLRDEAKNFVKMGAIIAFISLAVIYNAVPAYNNLKTAYSGIQRVNPYQVEAALWLEGHSEPSDLIFLTGQIQGSIRKWFKVISMRPIAGEKNPIPQSPLPANVSYVLVDYSQFALSGRNDAVNALQAWELQKFNESKPVFVGKEGLIRVYRL